MGLPIIYDSKPCRLIMKTVLLVLVACGLLSLCIQSGAKRFLLEEVTNVATDVKPNNRPQKSSTEGNTKSGSVPTVDAEMTFSSASDHHAGHIVDCPINYNCS